MASPPPANQPVTPMQIYEELLSQGAGTIRAVGIMANMINESSLNPEAVQQGVSDPGYGLVQWEESSYAQAPNLVTGNPQTDMKAQITYLAQTGGFTAADGATEAESAGNFAVNYEKCAECYEGGSQYTARQNNAATVAGWVSSGDWPTAAADATGQAQVNTATTAQNAANCVWMLPTIDLKITSIGGQCLLSKTQARALISAGILVAGGITALVGILLISGTANKIGQVANGALGVIPGGNVAKAAVGAGKAAASPGPEAPGETRQESAQPSRFRSAGDPFRYAKPRADNP